VDRITFVKVMLQPIRKMISRKTFKVLSNIISYLIIEIFNLPLVCTIQLSFRIDICFFFFFSEIYRRMSVLSDICKRALGKLDAARVSIDAEIITYSNYDLVSCETCIIFIILDNPSLKMQVAIFAAP